MMCGLNTLVGMAVDRYLLRGLVCVSTAIPLSSASLTLRLAGHQEGIQALSSTLLSEVRQAFH